MTIDEAIKHAEEVAVEQDKLCKRYDDASSYSRSHNEAIRTTDAKRCEECASEHRQLAEWLKDYKRLKEQEPCDDCISRQAVLKIIDGWYEQNRDTDNIEDLIVLITYMDSVNPQKPKSECEHDHEILKAYSDGASAVLDEVRAEIEERKLNSGGEPNRELAFNVCLQIIDGYMTEEDKV